MPGLVYSAQFLEESSGIVGGGGRHMENIEEMKLSPRIIIQMRSSCAACACSYYQR